MGSYRGLLYFLLTVAVTLHFCGVEADMVPCMGAPEVIISSLRSEATLANFSIVIRPRRPDGTVYTEAHVAVSLNGFQELLRPGSNCFEKTDFGFPVPADNPAYVQPYLAILPDNMLCSFTEHSRPIGDGGELKTISMLALHPDHQDFFVIFNVSTSSVDATVESFYSPSQNQSLLARYKQHGIKFSFELHNWPWNTTDLDSYITSQWGLDFSLPSAFNITNEIVDDIQQLNFLTTDGKLHFGYDVDQHFALDDLIYLRNQTGGDYFAYNQEPDGPIAQLLKNTRNMFSFCETRAPGVHYSRMMLDPSLTALFTEGPEPPSDIPSTSKSRGGLSGSAIAGIVIACILISAIAAFILALFIHPSLKNIFRPFRSRDDNAHSSL